MKRKLKTISSKGISEALAKAERYRFLNEPEEAESIYLDILAVEPENQTALRHFGLTLTDQFTGQSSDRYAEAEATFQKLTSPYERGYYAGILHERRAKAQLSAGHLAHSVVPRFEEAMRFFEEAEKIRPADNDDALLRWNRCARLLASLPELPAEEMAFEDHDSPPVAAPSRASRGK